MNRSHLLTSVIVGMVVAAPLAAQQQAAMVPEPRTATIQVNDSLKIKPSPELQKSLDDLAAAVQALALRVASDPQLRAAAILAASSFVATAQQAVAEQSVALQEGLKVAAERIAAVGAAQAAQQQKAKKP
jgi:hypothetical protein